MVRRSTAYTDALREDLAQRITDLHRDASVVKRLTHSIKRRDSVHLPMTQKVVDGAMREAHSVVVIDGARLTRQVKQDVLVTTRHYGSRSFATVPSLSAVRVTTPTASEHRKGTSRSALTAAVTAAPTAVAVSVSATATTNL